MNTRRYPCYQPSKDGLNYLQRSPEVEPGDLFQCSAGEARYGIETVRGGQPDFSAMSALIALWIDTSVAGVDPTPIDKLTRALYSAQEGAPEHLGLPVHPLGMVEMLSECRTVLDRALRAWLAKSDQGRSPPPADDLLNQGLIAAMDSVQMQIIRIAQDTTKTVEDRLQLIYGLDQRFRGKSNVELGRLLGVTKQAVQKANRKLNLRK